MADGRASVVQSPHILDFIAHSSAQTQRLGQRLGELLSAGDLVLLTGEFGVGKTQFVKGVAAGLGSADLVTSPSFVLINEYHTRRPRLRLYHADLYRIENAAEVAALELDDLLLDGVGVVEWAERATSLWRYDHLAVALRHLNDTKRVIRMTPNGSRAIELVEAFKQSVFL